MNRRHESLTDLANAKALLLRVYAAQARACTDAVTQRGHRALVDDRNCAATRQREEIEDAIRQLGGMPDDIVTEAHLFAIRDVGQAHRTLGSVIELTTP